MGSHNWFMTVVTSVQRGWEQDLYLHLHRHLNMGSKMKSNKVTDTFVFFLSFWKIFLMDIELCLIVYSVGTSVLRTFNAKSALILTPLFFCIYSHPSMSTGYWFQDCLWIPKSTHIHVPWSVLWNLSIQKASPPYTQLLHPMNTVFLILIWLWMPNLPIWRANCVYLKKSAYN